MKPLHRSGEDGFTLVEVLVGLMLTSILIAALAVLGSQFRSYLNANDRIEHAMELHAVARKIAEIIEQAESFPIKRNDAGQDLFLYGRQDSISFVSTLKLGVHRSGFRDVTILRSLQNGLVMETRFHRPGQAQVSDPATIELMNGNVSVRFQYYDPTFAPDEAKWLDKWDHPARLPQGVQVEVARTMPDGKSATASAFASIWVR